MICENDDEKYIFRKTHNQILTPPVTHIHIYHVCHFVSKASITHKIYTREDR